MAEKILGPFSMRYRGDYDPAGTYRQLDLVYLDGKTYLRIAEGEGNGVTPGTDTMTWVITSTSASVEDRLAAAASAQAAAQNQQGAEDARDEAETAKAGAEGARDAAVGAAGAAATSETNAANSATAAATSETNAAASATAAQAAAASVDGPGLMALVNTHKHDGTEGNGVKIKYNDLDDAPDRCPHKVGDIIQRDNPTSPAVDWPGTVWTAMAPGRVLVGVDPSDADFDTAGKTGGSKTHTNTISEMANHCHDSLNNNVGQILTIFKGSTSGKAGVDPNTGSADSNNIYHTSYTGGGQPYNIMNPYEVVHRWKRTA